MKVHSLFSSIQGEGLFQGYPSFFIRLYGCNLNCNYCDASEAVSGGKFMEMSVDEIIDKVKKAGIRDVCITGGEPFCQKEGLIELIDSLLDYRITLETNGSMDISEVKGKNVYFSVDWKTPGSGSTKFCKNNILSVRNGSGWIKFVVSDSADLEFVKNELKHLEDVDVFISPVFEKGVEFFRDVAEFVRTYPKLRLQIQLHKLVNIE